MRASEEQIKAAILHPEERVRLTALDYWCQCYSRDATIMPLVIQVVEQYGREGAFSILRSADDLAQTPATLDWLVGELERKYDVRQVDQDNYRFAVALALEGADPELLIPRQKDILRLPAFPEQLRVPLDERIRFHLMEWPQLWEEFERFGLRSMQGLDMTTEDYGYIMRLTAAMGRHVEHADKVIRAMDGKVAPSKREMMEHLDADLVEIVGWMRVPMAVPRIIRKMSMGSGDVLDRATFALGRIGTDIVVEEIASVWGGFDSDRRLVLTGAMEMIHTDRCIHRCMEFLAAEEDFDIAIYLAGAMLRHFCTEGIANACQLAMDDEEELTPEQQELKFEAVAVATIMGEDFPDYDEWHSEAIATNYGWAGYKPERMSQYF